MHHGGGCSKEETEEGDEKLCCVETKISQAVQTVQRILGTSEGAWGGERKGTKVRWVPGEGKSGTMSGRRNGSLDGSGFGAEKEKSGLHKKKL